MNKTIILTIISTLMLLFSGCQCTNENTTSLGMDENDVVAHAISVDREYMYVNYGGDYRWYETCIRLNDYLDEECDGSIEEITNIFQAITGTTEGGGFDTEVVMIKRAAGNTEINVVKSFWIEDFPMNEDAIKVTYMEAFQKLQEVNLPKPHSKNCILRKEVGPKAVNPQYIFGNLRSQIYVDAVTGEVSATDPAFEPGLAKPLGEWP